MKPALHWITPMTLLAALVAGAAWLITADPALVVDPLLQVAPRAAAHEPGAAVEHHADRRAVPRGSGPSFQPQSWAGSA